jgi:predicted  nucleic acid-binding Zn-ribbon protein
MTTEVDALQQSNAQLQQDLRSKTDALEQTAVEKREFQARVLQHAKKLRSDIATLRDRFKDSQEDVQRLQSEKAALATEYEALNKEYERVYANSAK